MNEHFLFTNTDDLATRSKNVICDLGGVENLLEYFKKHNNFMLLRNVGRFSDEQLTEFCRYLLYKEENGITDEINHPPDIPDEIMEKYIFFYESEKGLLPVRVMNRLKSLESNSDYHAGTEGRKAYFKKFFLNGYDFMKVGGVGEKIKIELECFKGKILNTDRDIPGSKPPDFFEEIQNRLNQAVQVNFTYNEIQELFDNNEYAFTKLFCIAIFYHPQANEKFVRILQRKYFNETPFNCKEIAGELNCTDASVWQVKNRIYRLAIPRAVRFALEISGATPNDLPQTNGRNFINLDNFSHFTFRNLDYTPNTELARTVYERLLIMDYALIDRFIAPSFRSFTIPASHLFVSHKFLGDVHLQQLLTWLDSRIYHFESACAAYVLEELIKKFYTEHDIPVNTDSLSDLNEIVSCIKKQSIPINQLSVKRQYINSVISEARSFLNAKKQVQSTMAILVHLREKGFEIKTHVLLKYLWKAKDIFSCFGHGNWTLNEWNKNGLIVGSFRTIIHTLLSNSKDPIHISEIYNYINALKKVSLNSISTNLKSDKENTYKVFNCSYFGLTEKKYDKHWHKIPAFKSSRLAKPVLLYLQQKYPDVIKFLNILYGYPEQHIRFIMDLKAGKYEYGTLRNRKAPVQEDAG